MDEVENPDLPAAGESSPTLRPVDEDEDQDSGVDVSSPTKHTEIPVDTAEADIILQNNNNAGPTRNPPSPNRPHHLPSRPPLTRESSNPPPQQTLLDAPNEFPSEPPDSLTLADLRRIRSTFPNTQLPEQKQEILKLAPGEGQERVYDFEYWDAQSLPVEVEEWFGYSEDETARLRRCREVFDVEWTAFREGGEGKAVWVDVTEDIRRNFVSMKIAALARAGDEDVMGGGGGEEERGKLLMCLTYIALGVWGETAGKHGRSSTLDELFHDGSQKAGSRLEEYANSSLQLQWIVASIDTLHASNFLPILWSLLQNCCEDALAITPDDYPPSQDPSEEMWCALTLLYLFLEVARTSKGEEGQKLRLSIAALEPNLLHYLTELIARLRWSTSTDEQGNEIPPPVPLTKMLLLAWKAILVVLGGLSDVETLKSSLKESSDTSNKDDADSKPDSTSSPSQPADDNSKQDPRHPSRGERVITASPLDYHLFRQEISSKYPAYSPPEPLFPLEAENNSILPPLRHRRPAFETALEDSRPGGLGTVGAAGTASILHQPIHIATPAPSPPPSPAGKAGGGKKQNYQTNQNFPFLYPPLDPTSNELGGKGSTVLQDAMVGREWRGSDVPASILEASELFAGRMRATRGMRQLWGVRGEFMRFERGNSPEAPSSALSPVVGGAAAAAYDESDDDGEEEEGFEVVEKKDDETAEQGQPLTSLPEEKTEEQKRLDDVEAYYRAALPHLQSFVLVLFRTVFNIVTAKDGALNDPGQGLPNGTSSAKPNTAALNGDPTSSPAHNTANEELATQREQEVTQKAISGILVLMLKWFKVNHILMYEYLTQLLLDANFVQLVLRMWQQQDLGRGVHYRLEREESNFFNFCKVKPGVERGVGANEEKEDEGEDDSVPPPIKLKRDEKEVEETERDDFPTHPPELDELGYSQTPVPSSPIKTYSWRNTFSSINWLRILQKITRRKTHRALLLVSFKSSTHLKKTLRIPIHELRYYTLKLFKSQVPFCGRKWRQSNMKIITAVWLSVPAELRDDWLSGGGGGMGGACVGDVDGTVEDALPLEMGIRGVSFWWNQRNFGREVVGGEGGGGGEGAGESGAGVLDGGEDWFGRELEKMEILGREDGVEGEEERFAEEGGWQGPIEGY